MRVLVTGGAGFIGSHLVDLLMAEGHQVTVVDSFDPFYDPAIKRENIAPHVGSPRFRLVETDIRDAAALRAELGGSTWDVIVHLAARAGVRPSIRDPLVYQEVNVGGTQVVLELAREAGVRHVVFASSSSVYGANPALPWREDDAVLRPISPYAGSKVSGELLGHVYSHLYDMRFVALRLFTVYGPRQRPDLAIRTFVERMEAGEPIPVFGDGETRRDYTFVGDIVAGIRAAIDYDASAYEVINLSNSTTVSLNELIAALERVLGRRAVRDTLPMQPGDLPRTWGEISKAERLLGYRPATDLDEGLAAFVAWSRRARPSG